MQLDLFHFLSFVAAKLALATAVPETPRVHFLFLAVDRIQRLDLWQRFFHDAPEDQYRIVFHCKDPVACRGQLKMSGISDDALGKHIEVIDTPAPSSYCTDLVSAENRLLEVALQPPFATAGSPSPAKPNFVQAKVHESTNPAPASSSFLAKQQVEHFTNVSSIKIGHANDKFVFVSDSTIPAKSFAEVHWSLTTGGDSHFCVFPREQWATATRSACVDDDTRCPTWAQKGECERNPNYMHFRCQRSCQVCNDDLGAIAGTVAFNEQIVAVKTHQWKILNRADAVRSVQLWKQGFLRHLMHMMHLNWHDSFRNHGCLDEFWHFAALYGVFPSHCMGKRNAHSRCNEWALQGECERNPAYMWRDCEAACSKCQIPASKSAGAQIMTMNLENGAEAQGKCDTFVKWPTASAMGRNNGMVQLDQELAGLATMQRGNMVRPETIVKISAWGLASLKKSAFLFVRKFTATSEIDGDCSPMADIFSRDVFSQTNPPKSAWAGQGVWMVDEENHVTLMTDPDAAHSFLVYNENMPSWSGKGTSCGKAVSITFKNGQAWNGQLDTSNGDFISFDNGVIWCRDASWRGDGSWLNTYNMSVMVRSKCGFKVIVTDSGNDAWSGRGKLDKMLGDTAVTTFNAKMKGEPVKLTATLSADGQTMHWHNGQTWNRDKKHWIPCACTPDGALWQQPRRPEFPVKAKPKCFFFNFGPAAGHVDLDRFLVGYYDVGHFHPPDCEVIVMDPDPQKAEYLRRQASIYKASFVLTTLPMTIPYTCEPSPAQGVEFINGKMHPAESGGPKISLVNIQRLLREKVTPQDHVVLRMDLGGVERDILSCLARSSSARLLDVMYLEAGGQDGSPMGVTDNEMKVSLKLLKESGVKIMPVESGYNHGSEFNMGHLPKGLLHHDTNTSGLPKPVSTKEPSFLTNANADFPAELGTVWESEVGQLYDQQQKHRDSGSAPRKKAASNRGKTST